MATTLGIIDDGYTEHVYVNGVPNLYPRVEFKFRPMTLDELSAYYAATDKMSGGQLRTLVAGLLAAKISEWDLKNSKGETVPITVANCLKLKERLFNRLFSVLNTGEAPDGVSERAADDVAGDAADLLEAAKAGRPIAEVREARLRKNS